MTPEFYCLAFSSPSITAATERFIINQAIIMVKKMKNGIEIYDPHAIGVPPFLWYVS